MLIDNDILNKFSRADKFNQVLYMLVIMIALRSYMNHRFVDEFKVNKFDTKAIINLKPQ